MCETKIFVLAMFGHDHHKLAGSVSRALLCVYCIKVPIKASPLSPEHQNTCTSGVIRVIAVTRGVINRGQPHDPGTWVASHTRRLVQPTIFRNIFMGTRMPAKGVKRVMARLIL